MAGFLDRLAARAQGRSALLTSRPGWRFEPDPPGLSRFSASSIDEVQQWDPAERDAALISDQTQLPGEDGVDLPNGPWAIPSGGADHTDHADHSVAGTQARGTAPGGGPNGRMSQTPGPANSPDRPDDARSKGALESDRSLPAHSAGGDRWRAVASEAADRSHASVQPDVPAGAGQPAASNQTGTAGGVGGSGRRLTAATGASPVPAWRSPLEEDDRHGGPGGDRPSQRDRPGGADGHREESRRRADTGTSWRSPDGGGADPTRSTGRRTAGPAEDRRSLAPEGIDGGRAEGPASLAGHRAARAGLSDAGCGSGPASDRRRGALDLPPDQELLAGHIIPALVRAGVIEKGGPDSIRLATPPSDPTWHERPGTAPEVHVHIGRVDVQLAPAPPAAAPTPRTTAGPAAARRSRPPGPDHDSYLARRRGEGS